MVIMLPCSQRALILVLEHVGIISASDCRGLVAAAMASVYIVCAFKY